MHQSHSPLPRRGAKATFRLGALAAACTLLIAESGAANAQQIAETGQPASDPQGLQSVVVTGIRASLSSAMNVKRDGQGVVDGINAEEIGKFPDTNLAESLQRISGVSIDRSIGEGSKVTVRGVGPDFNMVLLNGRQMPASSLQDTGPSNSRAFDFANLASESISAIEVYKTSRASTPTGGIGATINIKTARPLENPGLHSSIGLKEVVDSSNSNLPSSMQGKSATPEVSALYSNTFADGKFGVAISASHQERNLGFNQAAVPGGWRPFYGATNDWGTIPQNGAAGSENITNRPGPKDIYSVPQNINYSVNGIKRQRDNGQLTFQFAPNKDIRATLDYTYSENKIQTRRNELSAWFNFGPSTSSWTNGPVAGPKIYSELIPGNNSDIAMGGAEFATKNENKSLGLNLAWKVNDKLRLEFDAHSSSAASGADSANGSNASLGAASFNRGTSTVDFTQDFPVLSIAGPGADAALMQVTGSSFRNSYMKSEVDQAQLKGKFNLTEESGLDFGLSTTNVKNRSAYGYVQQDSWGGATNPGDYPDNVWHNDTLRPYFSKISGSANPTLYNQIYIWDFETVRKLAVAAAGSDAMYKAPTNFTTDRRVAEKSQSGFVQYNKDWDTRMPIHTAFGLRYEKTDVTSTALVPTPTGISWVSANEFSVKFADPGFTTLSGSYSYLLPSVDFDIDLKKDLKFRASYGESIGRPGWGDIQGGQTLNQQANLGGGTGAQGNPGLKPLKSKNFDLSLEWYYDRGSYMSVGYFRKDIENYIGVNTVTATPFSLHTPAGGLFYQEAVAKGCANSDTVCIRDYIFENHNGQDGVVRGEKDSTGHWTGTIAGQAADPIANFSITTPVNNKAASLDGWELNVQHMFGKTGFGVAANYTKVNSGLTYDNGKLGEQFALVGLSDSANLVGFYENAQWEIRAAYNWRGEFLAATADGAGNNPVYTEAYGQLDLNVGYKWNKHLSFQAEVINLNDGIQRLHGRTKEEVLAVTQTGPRYMVGLRYKF